MHEIFDGISKLKTAEERKTALMDAWKQSPTIADLLLIAFDPNVEFNLPSGDPPYKPCDLIDQHGRLHQEMRRMPIFLKDFGATQIPNWKRESLFVQLLESIEPKDAELLLAVKSKKFPYKNITRKLVDETFPGLIRG